jgi:hypothetical protein
MKIRTLIVVITSALVIITALATAGAQPDSSGNRLVNASRNVPAVKALAVEFAGVQQQ